MDLKTYRKLAKITLDEMSRLMGFANASVVSRHERGTRYPEPEAIQKYARVTDGAVTNDDWLRLRAETRSMQPQQERKAAHG